MSRGKELAKNTIIITIGKISTQFVSFFLLPLYTALLSTEEYGIVDLFNTYIQLLLPVASLMIEQGVFRYLIENIDNEKRRKELLSGSFFVIVGLCSVITILSLIIFPFLHNQYKYYLIPILVVSSFSNWALQVARGFRNITLYSVGSFITSVVTIICNVVFIAVLKCGAAGMFVATFLGNLVCVLFVCFYLKVYKYISIASAKKKSIVAMLKYSIPLIPNQLSLWIINSSDRTIVTVFLGIAANGILAISYKFSALFQTFFSMFQLSWHEVGTVHYNDSDRDSFFSETFDQVYRFFSAFCIVLMAILPFFFPLIVHSTYSEAYNTIPCYLVAALCNIIVGLLGVVYVAEKKTIEIAKSTIYSGLINVAVHLLLVKYIGLYAAAFSTLISYFSIMIYRMIDTKKYINIKYRCKTFVASGAMIVILLIPYYQENIIMRIMGCITACVYWCATNKKVLYSIGKDLYAFLKKR